MSKKLANWIDRIKLRIRRKEKVAVPPSWIENQGATNIDSDTVSLVVDKPRRKIRLPFLRTLKRVLAGFLFLVNFLSAVLGWSMGTPQVGIILLPNSFIILDYLWKTRLK